MYILWDIKAGQWINWNGQLTKNPFMARKFATKLDAEVYRAEGQKIVYMNEVC